MAQHSASVDDEDEADESGLEELGTLVLRVWREADTEHGFRARVFASDGANEPANMTVAADPDTALAAVKEWLDARWGSPTS